MEDDRAKVAEEEARLNELRARSRAGKERQARISERTLQEWQRTMDGRKIPIPQPKKRRRKKLRKHNELASGKGSVASYFSVVPPSSPGSSPHPPCAGVTPGARAAASAALVARGAKVAATLCSARVRRIFQAIDEFGRVVAAARTLNRLPFLGPIFAVGWPLDDPGGPRNQLKKSQKAGSSA